MTKYSTYIKSGDEFYTDSNGREMIKRKRDYRPTWNLKLHEPISGNYYPVTTKISLRDEKGPREFAVFTDRSQGGTSMKNGELELMVNKTNKTKQNKNKKRNYMRFKNYNNIYPV